MKYQKLFEKGYIGGVEIRNRVAMTAMGNGLATWDGEASPELIRFYEDRARGGCGLIFTEFTRVDENSGACNPNQLCIASRKHVRSVQRMAECVHRHGAKIFVQLPSLRAAMARMPLPVPMSSTRSPPLTHSSSTSRQRLVVSWPPVPKARPGSRMSLTRSVS